MNIPSPILAEIMSYFSLFELLQVLQVNKKFNQIASSQFLYKREYLRIWMNQSSSNDRPHANWKSLCLAGLALRAEWQNLPDSIFTISESVLLYEELLETLRSPPMVFPAMRRDIFSFPTLAQDFLANPEDQFVQDHDLEIYSDAIRSYLFENQQDLFFSTSVDALISIRWGVKKDKNRYSIGSNATDDTEKSENFLIRFFKSIKRVIQNWCQGVCLAVKESENPAMAYVDFWENYMNSCRKINSLFSPVMDLINEFYEVNFEGHSCPRVSFFKVMNRIWKKNVFELCKEVIAGQVVNEIEELRTSGDPYFCVSRRVVEAFLDLSLNELNVFFKEHSLVEFDGPYEFLHKCIVENFRENWKKGLPSYDLGMIFVPGTVRECRKVIQKKINEMQGLNPAHLDMEDYEKSESDLMIEIRAKNYKIPLDYSAEELAVFSQNKNEKMIDVFQYLEKYKKVYF